MEDSKDRFYRIKWFWNILKNGLFIFGVRNQLARFGFDFDPFYWVLEGVSDCERPKIKGEPSAYEFAQLNAEEITSIKKKILRNDDAAGLPNFHDQQICIGLEYRGEVAAFMIIELNDFNYNRKKFHLKENEAFFFICIPLKHTGVKTWRLIYAIRVI